MKSIARCAGLVILLVIGGFIVYGAVIWLTSAKTAAAAESQTQTKDFPGLFEREVKVGGEQATQTASDSMRLLAIDSAVEEFRAGAVAAAGTKAMAALPEVSSGVFNDLLTGPVSQKFPYIWPYIMSGSFVVIGNALGDDPVVAFYNPWFDVVLLTKWSFQDPNQAGAVAGFRLSEAVPITGRAFLENRPSLITDSPVWTDSTALFELRVVDATHRFVTAFEQRYPPFGRESATLSADPTSIVAAVSAAEHRVFDLLRWVLDAQDPKAPVNYAAGINELRDALSESSPAKLTALLPSDNPQSAETFFQLAPQVRKGLRPYLVIDQNVIFLDPINLPTGFLSVHFTPKGKSYQPGLVALFNLAASYPDR